MNEITPLDAIMAKVFDHVEEITNARTLYENVCRFLTPQEKKRIIESLQHRNCTNCQNEHCNLLAQDNMVQLAGECIDWYNEAYIGKAKVLQKYDFYSIE